VSSVPIAIGNSISNRPKNTFEFVRTLPIGLVQCFERVWAALQEAGQEAW
jgi:hypothetical protein